MLTKHKINLIQQLHEKKHRSLNKVFLVEGEKSVVELLASDFSIDELFITAELFKTHRNLIEENGCALTIVEPQEISNMSTLEANGETLAVVHQKKTAPLPTDTSEIVLALDNIRDPGNLGTIIRIADWYGITKIVASETTTEFYNPKVISASKGSFTRVEMTYTNLEEFLKKTSVPILGTYLSGTSVHTLAFPKSGILIMGNESHGISEKITPLITTKITIPSFGKAESLNVSIATALVLDNWKRSVL